MSDRLMDMTEAAEAPAVRPIPLKIAAVIGVLVTAMYLAVAIGQPEGIGPAIFWMVLIATASGLAWFADQFEGRTAAVVAAVIFFVLGILSAPLLAIIFLVAVLLCMVGFVRFPKR